MGWISVKIQKFTFSLRTIRELQAIPLKSGFSLHSPSIILHLTAITNDHWPISVLFLTPLSTLETLWFSLVLLFCFCVSSTLLLAVSILPNPVQCALLSRDPEINRHLPADPFVGFGQPAGSFRRVGSTQCEVVERRRHTFLNWAVVLGPIGDGKAKGHTALIILPVYAI